MSSSRGRASVAASGGAQTAAPMSNARTSSRESGVSNGLTGLIVPPVTVAKTFPAVCAAITDHLSLYSYKLPSDLGIVKTGTSKGLDVLVLSTFSLWGDALAEVWAATGDDASLGLWPFYCARKDAKGECVVGARPPKARLVPNCEWLEWSRQAVQALSPRVVVVLTWGDNADQNFVSLWGKKRVGNLPAAADVIELPHPDKNTGAFIQGWGDRVTQVLYNRHLVGAKRTADGAIDTFAVLKHQRARAVVPTRERRDAEVVPVWDGEYTAPETTRQEPAKKGLDDAVARRKAKAKQDALVERVARNRSQGQQQISAMFAAPSNRPKRPDVKDLNAVLRKPSTSALSEADSALTRSAETRFAPLQTQPVGISPQFAHLDLQPEGISPQFLRARAAQATADAVARRLAYARKAVGLSAVPESVRRAQQASADFWADDTLPAPTPQPVVPYRQRPATATLNLQEEVAAARNLEDATGPIEEPQGQSDRDETWAREIEERLAASAETEVHAPQVPKGKYEDT